MKENISGFISVGLLTFVMLTGCKQGNNKNTDNLIDIVSNAEAKTDSNALSKRVEKIKKVFYNTPSAIEISQMLKESGAAYSEAYTGDPMNVSKYSSRKGQSLNLGIYAADLSYAGIYQQKEDALLYLKCANRLATSLGIPNAFNENTIARINANMNNQDSLLNIIAEDYWNTDAYLKNNDRQEVSAFIMVGGWIEGLYIGTQIASHTTGNKELINRIAEQKLSLDEIVALINTYPDNTNIEGIKDELKKLQDAYLGVNIKDHNMKISADTSTNTSTLGGEEKVLITPEQFKNIAQVTATIRTAITKDY